MTTVIAFALFGFLLSYIDHKRSSSRCMQGVALCWFTYASTALWAVIGVTWVVLL